MTDAERSALEWLDDIVSTGRDQTTGRKLATLKALLAEPRLPAALSDELVEKIWWACDGSRHREVAEKIVDAIRAHLTAPKTKKVEVWHVEAFRHQDDMPTISLHTDLAGAEKMAWCLKQEQRPPRHFSCAHVTGPHKQEVPNG